MAASKVIKEEGGENDLLERIAADEAFMLKKEEIASLLSPEKFVGRAPKQTEEYLEKTVFPRIRPYIDAGRIKKDEGLSV